MIPKLVIYLISGYIGLCSIFLMWYYRVFTKIKNWWYKRNDPQNCYNCFFHHDSGITTKILKHVTEKSFKHEGGSYILTEKALRHARSNKGWGVGVSPIPDIHYIFGNPNPIVFKKLKDLKGKTKDAYELDAQGLRKVEKNTFITQLIKAAAQEDFMKIILIVVIINILATAAILLLWFDVVKHPVSCVIAEVAK